MNISIHAPTRGATFDLGPDVACTWNFNSRPYARGDKKILAFAYSKYISIHAPTRGATSLDGVVMTKGIWISIHAPTRGATKCRKQFHAISLFQFTPLREGRRSRRNRAASTFRFQFTPLREGRPVYRPNCFNASIFQFTPLREGRRSRAGAPSTLSAYFNSRPYARGDSKIR